MTGAVVLGLRLLAALALYGFIGWALIFFHREVQRQGVGIAGRRIPGITITIRQAEEIGGMRHFNQPEILIGRDPGCDIPILDDTVSVRHARLNYHHNQWWLEDLASTNGTRLNGLPVTIPTVITSGDNVQCGGTGLGVSLSENIIIEPTQRLAKQNPSPTE